MIDELFDFPFYNWEEKLKEKPFLKQPFGDLWESYSWGEVGMMARKLATGLKSMDLDEKSHIGLVSKNCREWIIADLAISMAGHISVPFFPTLKSNIFVRGYLFTRRRGQRHRSGTLFIYVFYFSDI